MFLFKKKMHIPFLLTSPRPPQPWASFPERQRWGRRSHLSSRPAVAPPAKHARAPGARPPATLAACSARFVRSACSACSACSARSACSAHLPPRHAQTAPGRVTRCPRAQSPCVSVAFGTSPPTSDRSSRDRCPRPATSPPSRLPSGLLSPPGDRPASFSLPTPGVAEPTCLPCTLTLVLHVLLQLPEEKRDTFGSVCLPPSRGTVRAGSPTLGGKRRAV